MFVTSKNEFSNSPIHEFKVIDIELIHHQKGVLKDSLTFMQQFKFVNWRIRFLMSRIGYLLDVFWSLLSDDRSSKDEVGEMKPSAKIDIQKVNAYVECLCFFLHIEANV